MSDVRFSERHGFAAEPAEITVRHDAPDDLRGLLVDFAYECGADPHDLRTIVCRVLMKRPDASNWSAFPNVDGEVRRLLDDCKWFEVYDVLEAVYQEMQEGRIRAGDGTLPNDRFAQQLNALFIKKGIGWQLIEGRIEVRGPEAFEATVRPAVSQLEAAGLKTAAQELHEALHDLGRRPAPDITGAIQHAMAAAECVCRTAGNDPNGTLGAIIDRRPGLVPRPLDEALKKIWGYSSEMARHVREGRAPSYEEAELVVVTSAGVATYLSRKLAVPQPSGEAGAK